MRGLDIRTSCSFCILHINKTIHLGERNVFNWERGRLPRARLIYASLTLHRARRKSPANHFAPGAHPRAQLRGCNTLFRYCDQVIWGREREKGEERGKWEERERERDEKRREGASKQRAEERKRNRQRGRVKSRNVSVLVLYLVKSRCVADNVRECPFLGLWATITWTPL